MYKLRCKVAEPGTIITPPGSGSKLSKKSRNQDWTLEPTSTSSDEESYDEDSGSDRSSEKEAVEFVAEECLFCNHTSKDFDENLSHMHQTHSLFVPFQSSLAVDLQTLIWYLHMVLSGYRECICCGKRRRTVEAIQQHMVAMGHCRFNVTDEMTEFYDMALLDQQNAEGRSQPDDRTLRLPSGKLLTHRSYVESTSKSRLREKSPLGTSELPAPQKEDRTSQALTKKDRKEQALTTQISKLRTGDQMSLMHLPESQQRSLLVAHKKEMDRAKRSERRKRSHLDRTGNKGIIDTHYYKQEVPIYMGG